jgi:hypothetical protein
MAESTRTRKSSITGEISLSSQWKGEIDLSQQIHDLMLM